MRRRLRAARRGLSSAERLRAQRIVLARLRRLACIRRARRIGLYHAVDSELDPAALTALPGKIFYFPVLVDHHLQFAEWDGAREKPNRFGIPEPVGTRRLSPAALDLAVVPLVGFDPAGNRLGTGGGFYDRSFAFRLARPHVGPRLVGLAFACQQIDALPAAPWDVPLDLVVTEQAVFR